jgi:hypothetical protein
MARIEQPETGDGDDDAVLGLIALRLAHTLEFEMRPAAAASNAPGSQTAK